MNGVECKWNASHSRQVQRQRQSVCNCHMHWSSRSSRGMSTPIWMHKHMCRSKARARARARGRVDLKWSQKHPSRSRGGSRSRTWTWTWYSPWPCIEGCGMWLEGHIMVSLNPSLYQRVWDLQREEVLVLVLVQHIWLPTEQVSEEQQTQMLEGQKPFCPQDSAWHAYWAHGAMQPVASAKREWEEPQTWKGGSVQSKLKPEPSPETVGNKELLQRQWEISEGSGSW